jgi:hypothetical protein
MDTGPDMTDFRLLMIGAMYENGGNTTHRFLDGHPGLYVYPFESQIGTRLVNDHLTSLFPVKYRWPVFALDATPQQDYHAIIDEETNIRVRTPHVSKFRHVPFDLADADRQASFVRYVEQRGRSRATTVAAFYVATFEAWKGFKRRGREQVYVGYSPIIGIDADKILADLPQAHVLHVVRNPWSAYADTKKRAVPLSLHHYMLGWTLNQYYALFFQACYPDRFHLVRAEDVIADSVGTLGRVLDALGLGPDEALKQPTWNGTALDEVYPWGTLRKVTPGQNRQTADELSASERDRIRDYAWQYLDVFDYKEFLV